MEKSIQITNWNFKKIKNNTIYMLNLSRAQLTTIHSISADMFSIGNLVCRRFEWLPWIPTRIPCLVSRKIPARVVLSNWRVFSWYTKAANGLFVFSLDDQTKILQDYEGSQQGSWGVKARKRCSKSLWDEEKSGSLHFWEIKLLEGS